MLALRGANSESAALRTVAPAGEGVAARPQRGPERLASTPRAPPVGPRGWERLLPSSVLDARQAQKPPDVSRAGLPSDGEEVGGCPGHR